MEPLAKVEKYSDVETLAWRVSVGDFYGVPCYEKEATIKADAINAAFLARVRPLVEAAQKVCDYGALNLTNDPSPIVELRKVLEVLNNAK